MNDENSVTAGTKSRSTLRKVGTNAHTKKAVMRIVTVSASSAAFLCVMVGVYERCRCQPQLSIPSRFPNTTNGIGKIRSPPQCN